LFRETKAGDLVFHYDGKTNAINSVSVVDGAAFDRPIVWAARGSYARERRARPTELPGYVVPLRSHRALLKPLTLETLRAHKPALKAMIAELRNQNGARPLYFPFELSDRPVRPMQGYAFKLPAAFVHHFALVQEPSPLTISDDATVVSQGFNRWRAALLEGARREGDLWIQSSDRFVFRNESEQKAQTLGARTALGIDPVGKRWAVQINEANEPGTPNVASAIALDNEKRPFLLRQGRLNPSIPGERPVLYQEFRRLTGLTPVKVINGNTSIDREWHIVTALDIPNDEIRASTARFVDACVIARSASEGSGALGDLAIIAELAAHDETGGTYMVGAQVAREPKVVRKWQGEVWAAMAKLLRAQDFAVEKPRPVGRYEIDVEVVRGACRLLVEIKTSAAPTDVYGGLGQLLIYAKLLPRLASYRPVLLLPDPPAPPLAKALADLGVALCTFKCVEQEGAIRVSFSPEFFELCGLRAPETD
jgi:hypothetical protein